MYAVERQDLSRVFLAHHELENAFSVIITLIIAITVGIIIILMLWSCHDM